MSGDVLQYRNGILHWSDHQLLSLAQRKIELRDFPLYVYSRQILRRRFEVFQRAFPKGRIHFAMKSNHWGPLLSEFKIMGSHVDVVSIGEVRRALEVGFRPDQILFSGVGKTRRELDEATGLGIFQINVESEHELEKILSLNRPARIGFRWTPGLDVKTHPFIKTSHDDTKFGLSESDVRRLVQRIHHHPKVHLKGISLHLGSQIMEMNDFRMAFLALKELLLSLPCQVENVDLGGGLGIDYRHQNLEDDEKRLEAYQKVVHEIWDKTPWTLLFEPGRFLVARAGGILTQVQAVKNTRTKKIVVVDAGMTHLIRPVLYDAFHGVFPLIQRSGPFETVDIVGPICESSDFLALDRSLPVIENGDFLWIADVGAYGSSMASGYNLRPEAEQTFIEDL